MRRQKRNPEKCEAVFRRIARQNKNLGQKCISVISVFSLTAGLCLFLAACATHAPPPAMPAVPLPPPPPTGEPADLINLSAAQLRALFGTPAFIRAENGPEIWRYDNKQCRAFFFLYPDATSKAVRHVETVPRGKEMAADASCLAVLRRPVS